MPASVTGTEDIVVGKKLSVFPPSLMGSLFGRGTLIKIVPQEGAVRAYNTFIFSMEYMRIYYMT